MGGGRALIPNPTGSPEAELREPGSAFDDAVRLNFAQPALAPFSLRIDRMPVVGEPDATMIEVHQPHPRGTKWAILEFPLAPPLASASFRFRARLLPARSVVLTVHAPGLKEDIASFPVNHHANHFAATLDDELAQRLSEAEWVRLGLTLPQRTWFVFQLAGATIESIEPAAAQ
jgi:hypothetical protein